MSVLHRHLSFAENSGSRVPVIGSRLRRSQRQPVHFAVTNAAKVGRDRGASLVAHLEGAELLVNYIVGSHRMGARCLPLTVCRLERLKGDPLWPKVH